MAGLANFKPYTPQAVESGFVIVAEDSGGGRVGIHDRKSVVLAPESSEKHLSRVDRGTCSGDRMIMTKVPRPYLIFAFAHFYRRARQRLRMLTDVSHLQWMVQCAIFYFPVRARALPV